jgi:hypothetical protein
MPKRLRAEEAFWQLEPDLQKAEPCGDAEKVLFIWDLWDFMGFT